MFNLKKLKALRKENNALKERVNALNYELQRKEKQLVSCKEQGKGRLVRPSELATLTGYSAKYVADWANKKKIGRVGAFRGVLYFREDVYREVGLLIKAYRQQLISQGMRRTRR